MAPGSGGSGRARVPGPRPLPHSTCCTSLRAEPFKPTRHTYGHTHGDVTYVHMLLDKRTTAIYMNLFCRMDSIWLINNAFPISLSKSRPAVQIGRPAGGTGSIFLLTCGEQNKSVNLLTPHFHATNLSVLTLVAFPVCLRQSAKAY